MPAAPARDPLYRGYRFPAEIISYAVWLYYRFHLSHRDIEDLLAERGVQVSYEAIRLWCRAFGPALAAGLRRHRRRAAGKWHCEDWGGALAEPALPAFQLASCLELDASAGPAAPRRSAAGAARA